MHNMTSCVSECVSCENEHILTVQAGTQAEERAAVASRLCVSYACELYAGLSLSIYSTYHNSAAQLQHAISSSHCNLT